MSEVDLTHEFEKIVHAFSLDREAVRSILLDTADAAFCSESLKAKLRDRVRSAFSGDA